MTFSYGLLHMDTPVLADLQNLTIISSDTGCHLENLPRVMTGLDGKKESKKSMLLAHHNDDDDLHNC